MSLRHQQRIERSPAQANRVHAALIRTAARRGAAEVVRDRAAFAREVRRELGIANWLAPLFQSLLVQLVQILLPIVIAWLESQLTTASADPTTGSIDRQLERFAREAAA
jgi:hypothetical protein